MSSDEISAAKLRLASAENDLAPASHGVIDLEQILAAAKRRRTHAKKQLAGAKEYRKSLKVKQVLVAAREHNSTKKANVSSKMPNRVTHPSEHQWAR